MSHIATDAGRCQPEAVGEQVAGARQPQAGRERLARSERVRQRSRPLPRREVEARHRMFDVGQGLRATRPVVRAVERDQHGARRRVEHADGPTADLERRQMPAQRRPHLPGWRARAGEPPMQVDDGAVTRAQKGPGVLRSRSEAGLIAVDALKAGIDQQLLGARPVANLDEQVGVTVEAALGRRRTGGLRSPALSAGSTPRRGSRTESSPPR